MSEKWTVGLPVFPPGEVLDNSTKSEYIRCMRRGLYKYGLRRSFEGKSFAIQYGIAYHKYRETVEGLMREKSCKMTDEIHSEGLAAAEVGWEDPPIEHRHSHLDRVRLFLACRTAKTRIEQEQSSGSIKVTRSEDSFDLELPYVICHDCGWADYEDGVSIEKCRSCESSNVHVARHGGRVDQFVEFSGGMYIRDFKTTGYKTKHYEKKFDPSAQIQGYVWAGSQLAGRRFSGALIETVYNTKTKGPEVSQHYVDFSTGQQEQWVASQMMHEQFIRLAWSRVEELGYLAFPQNTQACTDLGICPYREACLMGSAREIESWLENYTIYSHWDFMNPEEEEGQI